MDKVIKEDTQDKAMIFKSRGTRELATAFARGLMSLKEMAAMCKEGSDQGRKRSGCWPPKNSGQYICVYSVWLCQLELREHLNCIDSCQFKSFNDKKI